MRIFLFFRLLFCAAVCCVITGCQKKTPDTTALPTDKELGAGHTSALVTHPWIAANAAGDVFYNGQEIAVDDLEKLLTDSLLHYKTLRDSVPSPIPVLLQGEGKIPDTVYGAILDAIQVSVETAENSLP